MGNVMFYGLNVDGFLHSTLFLVPIFCPALLAAGRPYDSHRRNYDIACGSLAADYIHSVSLLDHTIKYYITLIIYTGRTTIYILICCHRHCRVPVPRTLQSINYKRAFKSPFLPTVVIVWCAQINLWRYVHARVVVRALGSARIRARLMFHAELRAYKYTPVHAVE